MRGQQAPAGVYNRSRQSTFRSRQQKGPKQITETVQVPLAASGIARDFAGVRVLHDINIGFRRGEVHAIIGENGAGKSTLMKILSGYLEPTEGTVKLDGKPVTFRNSGEAEAHGVILIHQETNLAGDLSAAANIFLGRELRRGPFLDERAMQERAASLLQELDTRIDPAARVADLSVSDQQMVEIAKAMWRGSSVLIMDEPTDVLTGRETEVLFKLIRNLTAAGTTVIFISHKLPEVRQIADRVTVLRDGKVITTQVADELDEDQMATLMVGRELQDMYPAKPEVPATEPVLEVREFTVPGHVQNVSFTLRRGEILGFSGLVGAGRTELFEGLLGLRPASGQVLLEGRPVRIRTPRDAARLGIAYVSEDRKGKGLLVDMPMKPNVTLLALERLARPFINDRLETAALKQAISDFDIRAANPSAPVSSLSGGNQQKVVLGKVMQIDPEIIILDEPTRGIDVGTKRQIYFLVRELVSRGKSVIVISSELPEVIGLSDRVVVLHQGRVGGILGAGQMTEEVLVRHATGLEQQMENQHAH